MDDESIVILENNGVLPVKNGATVALIGPQAGQTTVSSLRLMITHLKVSC